RCRSASAIDVVRRSVRSWPPPFQASYPVALLPNKSGLSAGRRSAILLLRQVFLEPGEHFRHEEFLILLLTEPPAYSSIGRVRLTFFPSRSTVTGTLSPAFRLVSA